MMLRLWHSDRKGGFTYASLYRIVFHVCLCYAHHDVDSSTLGKMATYYSSFFLASNTHIYYYWLRINDANAIHRQFIAKISSVAFTSQLDVLYWIVGGEFS